MNAFPFVSIVMPTYNRASILAETLASMRDLTYPPDCLECIVVDDGSKDETPAVLNAFATDPPFQFTHLRQQNRGPAAARNLGVRHASGEYIAFTDDDCMVHSEWLTNLIAGFKSSDVGGVGGIVLGQSNSEQVLNRYHIFRGMHSANLSGNEVPPFLITGNCCYRRDILLELGGFDEAIRTPGGEDPDLSFRVGKLGYRLSLNRDAIVYHLHETQIRDFLKSFYYYGRGYRYIQEKHDLPKGKLEWRKTLSPRYFAYRIKRYHRADGLDLYTSIMFAILDHARELAWMQGYRSLETLGR